MGGGGGGRRLGREIGLLRWTVLTGLTPSRPPQRLHVTLSPLKHAAGRPGTRRPPSYLNTAAIIQLER